MFFKFILDVDKDGRTKLYTAAWKNETQLANKLLNAAKDLGILSTLINKAGKDGCTPLFIASHDGHLPMVQLLLEPWLLKATIIDKTTNDGSTPLLVALQKSH